MAELDFDATLWPQAIDEHAAPDGVVPEDPVYDALMLVDNNDPTEASIMAYLGTLHQSGEAGGVEPWEFYKEGDLHGWRIAWNMRQAEGQMPIELDGLHIRTILYHALTPFDCPATGMHVRTFQDRVTRGVTLFTQWRTSKLQEGIDTKAKERNKQAQRRFRARQTMRPDSLEYGREMKVQQLKSMWKAAIETRKRVIAEQDALVAQARADWVALRDAPLPEAEQTTGTD